MGFSKNLNSNRRETVPEGIKLDDINYINIKKYAGKKLKQPITLCGFFISKGKYGLGVTLLGKVDDELTGINIPSWYTDRFKEATDEEVQQILDEKLVITAVDEKTTNNGTTYVITFEDVE